MAVTLAGESPASSRAARSAGPWTSRRPLRVRGDRSAGKFSVFSFDGAQHGAALLAVESVNSPADHMAARRLLGARRTLSPGDLADPSFDLKAYSREAPLPA
jgi:3-phenylpropionate/trans-cinnamate dioxygenase ferredoxin reductase subunit